MTIYVSVANPTPGQEIGAAAAYTVNWSCSTDTPGWVILAMRFRLCADPGYSADLINDANTTGLTGQGTASASRSFTIPANTMTVGNTYYLRLMGNDNGGGLGWVDMPIVATGQTVTPTITVPAAAAVIGAPSSTVTWTLSTGTQQSHYQVQVLNGATITYDSGEVASSAQTTTALFPDTGVARTVRVRAKRGNGYAWSAWATQNVTVSHIAPMTPVISALIATDVAGIGFTHALVATITQPTPAGGAPAVASMEVYVRAVGDAGNGALVDTVLSGFTSYTYKSPSSGVSYQMRVRVVSSDGRYAYSAWVSANAPILLRGVVLYSLAAPTVVRVFRYNNDEAEDDYQPEAQLIQYDGRPFPVAEFGTSSSRELKVSIDLKTDADRDALRTMLLSRSMLLYRDRRGRKLYALVLAAAIKDTFYGYSTELTITVLDNPADRSV